MISNPGEISTGRTKKIQSRPQIDGKDGTSRKSTKLKGNSLSLKAFYKEVLQKNKFEIYLRAKKKKTETGRIRKLVDIAYESDPR